MEMNSVFKIIPSENSSAWTITFRELFSSVFIYNINPIKTFLVLVAVWLAYYRYSLLTKSKETPQNGFLFSLIFGPDMAQNVSQIPRGKILFNFHIPFVDGFYLMYLFFRDGVKILENFFSKNPDAFWMSFGTTKIYFLNSPEFVQKRLTSTNPEHLCKPELQKRAFVGALADGLLNSDKERWSRGRKLVSRAFTYKALQSNVPYMCSIGRILVENLEKRCPNGGSFEGDDVWRMLHFYGIKIVAHLVLGDLVSDVEATKFQDDFTRFKELALEKAMNPFFQFGPIWYFHPKRIEYKQKNDDVDTFFYKIIKAYRDNQETKVQDCQNNDAESDKQLGIKKFECLIEEMIQSGATDYEIYSEIGTFMIAGQDTVASTVQMLVMHLCGNPIHQEKCRMEVEKLLPFKCSDGESGKVNDLTMEDLSNLKHLERCIQETLRITHILPINSAYIEAPLKLTDSLEIPKNSTIMISPWALHRNPKYFPNPDVFDPDRFLPENIKQRHPYSYIPFGAALRNCIGSKFAMIKMKVLMAYILYNFEMSSTDKWNDLKLLFEATIKPVRPYHISFRRRAHDICK